MKINYNKNKLTGITVLFLLSVIFYLSQPSPLFKAPLSIVLKDKNHQLLSARIAKDGQWRFPKIDSVPIKFQKALLTFEDKRFYSHIGIDFISIIRAIKQNLTERRIVSGASTITMQVIRLSRKGKRRTFLEKLKELFLALRIECAFSKKEILKFYATYAPFGGNVVGLEAACWRYYKKKPNQLTWSEATTLAVLPNSPSLIHFGRNRKKLVQKRNFVLNKLKANGTIDENTFKLALLEPLPKKPNHLPNKTPHLVDYINKNNNSQSIIITTIDNNIQKRVSEICAIHNNIHSRNNIYNLAAIVVEIETGEVLAYIGNQSNNQKTHAPDVDIIQAKRSTGSIIKPFFYALSLQDGFFYPNQFIDDIPTYINGYRPKNYNKKYAGKIPFSEALSKSLNIPFVLSLQEYGFKKFHRQLNNLGFTTFSKPAEYYGLSIILGGGEVKLFELANQYSNMGRTLLNYNNNNSRYDPQDWSSLKVIQTKPKDKKYEFSQPIQIDAGSIWHTFQAMRQVIRPSNQGNWQQFNSSYPLAWKTGTSFGFRDAWAVGVSPKYTVAIWVGNADGEGRPGLIGVRAAAPLLFDICSSLNMGNNWFEKPFDALKKVKTCKVSGYLANPQCPVLALNIPISRKIIKKCPFHKLINLDSSKTFQVNSECYSLFDMKREIFFTMPSIQANYYKNTHPNFRVEPIFLEGCNPHEDENNPIDIIYPRNNLIITQTIGLSHKVQPIIFKAAHKRKSSTLYWHLDNEYLGITHDFHEIEIYTKQGNHIISVLDKKGNKKVKKFEINQRSIK